MTQRTVCMLMLAITGCAAPDPDHAIVTVGELRDHPHHPCAPLLPEQKGARYHDFDEALACILDHCIEQVGGMDPGRDLPRLHDLCLGDEHKLIRLSNGCRLAACERLLPAMPGLAYPLSATTVGLLHTGAWTGPITESSRLLEQILRLGPKASCDEVINLGAVLETMVLEGQTIPWDQASARATLALARWHHASCPSDRGSFAEVLQLIPDELWDQLVAEEAGGR